MKNYLTLLGLCALLSAPSFSAEEGAAGDAVPNQDAASQEAIEKGLLDPDLPSYKPTRTEKQQRRYDKNMARYEATGKVKRCVSLTNLRRSRIFDDQTILFVSGAGSRGYLVKLPHRCLNLGREERFSYATSIGSLCSNDIITVIDSFGRPWGSCGMGKFIEMKRIPKEEREARAAAEAATVSASTDSVD